MKLGVMKQDTNMKEAVSAEKRLTLTLRYLATGENVGVNGRVSDGGVLRESNLKMAMDMNILDFPENAMLPGVNQSIPYVFIADEAFPSSVRIVKPFRDRGLTSERKIFNFLLSHARRVVENAFGIMGN
ncbi:hypothetical protein ILUMI_21692 [Ignelater luminosus]|uniref:DDE Tnp4 domain-containing protein n=1 Tax=Ignelater luminosus TaxID=2038154 RepID=A0A8K0FXS3_IGNLU|nr:hypothetical protein ILUMI_21692 [Ignelater luminosus]